MEKIWLKFLLSWLFDPSSCKVFGVQSEIRNRIFHVVVINVRLRRLRPANQDNETAKYYRETLEHEKIETSLDIQSLRNVRLNFKSLEFKFQSILWSFIYFCHFTILRCLLHETPQSRWMGKTNVNAHAHNEWKLKSERVGCSERVKIYRMTRKKFFFFLSLFYYWFFTQINLDNSLLLGTANTQKKSYFCRVFSSHQWSEINFLRVYKFFHHSLIAGRCWWKERKKTLTSNFIRSINTENASEILNMTENWMVNEEKESWELLSRLRQCNQFMTCKIELRDGRKA